MTTTEPISISEAVRLAIIAVIVCLQAFNVWNPTTAQNAAILGLYAAASVVLSVVARSKSTPTSKVALTTADVSLITATQNKAV
jgi:hypothetical protein